MQDLINKYSRILTQAQSDQTPIDPLSQVKELPEEEETDKSAKGILKKQKACDPKASLWEKCGSGRLPGKILLEEMDGRDIDLDLEEDKDKPKKPLKKPIIKKQQTEDAMDIWKSIQENQDKQKTEETNIIIDGDAEAEIEPVNEIPKNSRKKGDNFDGLSKSLLIPSRKNPKAEEKGGTIKENSRKNAIGNVRNIIYCILEEGDA